MYLAALTDDDDDDDEDELVSEIFVISAFYKKEGRREGGREGLWDSVEYRDRGKIDKTRGGGCRFLFSNLSGSFVLFPNLSTSFSLISFEVSILFYICRKVF